MEAAWPLLCYVVAFAFASVWQAARVNASTKAKADKAAAAAAAARSGLLVGQCPRDLLLRHCMGTAWARASAAAASKLRAKVNALRRVQAFSYELTTSSCLVPANRAWDTILRAY